MGYTILMNDYKMLIPTTTCTLYAHENLVDALYFIIPKTYADIDLGDFTCTMVMKFPDDTVSVEVLTRDEDVYKENYYRFTYPAKSIKLTRMAGDVSVSLKLNHVDATTLSQYSLTTSDCVVHVSTRSDLYNFSDDTLERFDEIVGQLDAKLQTIEQLGEQLISNKTYDLGFDEVGTLHISSGIGENKVLIGDGVNVSIPSIDEDALEDGINDGILDADAIYRNVTL